MTDTPSLRERVARGICYARGNCAGDCQRKTGSCRALVENLLSEHGPHGAQADAAISLCREEFARVAEEQGPPFTPSFPAASQIASAIRSAGVT